MNIIKSSPELQSITKTGKIKYWVCEVLEDKNRYFTRTKYWQENSKIQYSEPYEAFPKNIGKSNETTAKEQALKEFDSIILKQKDSGYSEDGKVNNSRPLPMLANKYNDSISVKYNPKNKQNEKKITKGKKHKLQFPCYVQPKFDGMRACYNNTERFWSRKGKSLLKETTGHLYFDAKKYIFDGEIMLDNGKFEMTMQLVKKYYKNETEKLKFFVFDLIDENLTYEERYKIIKAFKFPKNIEVVTSYECKNAADVEKYLDKFIKEGYEGAILRNKNGKYLINQRSNDLLKYKRFIDEEFEIIDVIPAGESGGHKEFGKFICKLGDQTFDVNPQGSEEIKKEYLKNKKNYIGKLLTVKFQEYSEYGVPRFGIGISVRDYE